MYHKDCPFEQLVEDKPNGNFTYDISYVLACCVGTDNQHMFASHDPIF